MFSCMAMIMRLTHGVVYIAAAHTKNRLTEILFACKCIIVLFCNDDDGDDGDDYSHINWVS